MGDEGKGDRREPGIEWKGIVGSYEGYGDRGSRSDA